MEGVENKIDCFNAAVVRVVDTQPFGRVEAYLFVNHPSPYDLIGCGIGPIRAVGTNGVVYKMGMVKVISAKGCCLEVHSMGPVEVT